MPFLLRAQVIGAAPEIAVTSEHFEALHNAHLALVAGGAIEEKFEILLSNYLDLEKTVLSLSAEQMVLGEVSYPRMFEARNTINRMLINLLTTTRLYLDHLPHHANEIIGKPRQGEVITLLNQEYDADFRYQFMEALRNYVQHRGFPAHGISFPGHRVEHARRDFVFSLEFTALRQRLADDDKFKKTVLAKTPDTVDLKEYCRYYVERLSAIHERVRALTDPVLDPARALIGKAIAEYEADYKRKPLGLAALHRNEQGKLEQTVPLLLDWDDIRLALRKRNREMVNLRDRCVTSAIQSPK
jgi:hypothetical protein